MSRRRSLVAGWLAAAGLAAPLAGAALPALAAEPAGPAARTPVHHVVVVMQDHRSFDHYFGTRPGVDGLPAGVCLPAGPHLPCAAPYRLGRSSGTTSFNDGRRYLERQLHGGRMDGFVTAYAGTAADGRATMGHYDRRDLPYYWRLADDYVLMDHFFSALPANGVANRYLSVTAAAPPRGATTVPTGGWPDVRTVFDALTDAGVSWRIYVEHYGNAHRWTDAETERMRARVPLLALAGRDPAALAGHVVDLERYYEDAADDHLPAVSWVVATGPTERPPAAPGPGQRFVRGLVTTLQASRAWPSSAFFLTYDSSGGWYDHVPPPAWNGAARGARVPTLLVSPYARRGLVDHDVMDATALLRFIEDNWRVAPLTRRDAGAPSLLAAFDFGHARRADLASVPVAAPAGNASWAVIYGAYGGALVIVAALVRWLTRGRSLTGPEPPAQSRPPGPGPVAEAGAGRSGVRDRVRDALDVRRGTR
ncbi:MAG: alkaline phosphatase family protein [Frankiaceae bacterium]